MLDEENCREEEQGREGEAGEDIVRPDGPFFLPMPEPDAQKNGQEHCHYVLHQQVTYRKMDSCSCACMRGHSLHYQRDGE